MKRIDIADIPPDPPTERHNGWILWEKNTPGKGITMIAQSVRRPAIAVMTTVKATPISFSEARMRGQLQRFLEELENAEG